MSILVAYASKHGATQEIAERIAGGLRVAGRDAEVQLVEEADDLADHEGFVVGSAAYSTHWLKEAADFVRRNRDLLAQRPVWLFSSGPLSAEAMDAKGHDLRAAAEPKEIPEFREAIHPREHRVFFGALDPDSLSFAERSLRRLPAARAILPEGDFRDWARIDEWAAGIAQEMARLDAAREVEKPR